MSSTKNLRLFLIKILETLLKWEYLLRKSSNLKKVKVYDLVNVEVSSRFMSLDGLVLHNCLGMSYDMTKIGLAKKLTLDTGKKWSEDNAQILIDLFMETYQTYYDFKEEKLDDYEDEGYLKLKDGWYLWGDNDNFRSVGNFVSQGQGACIMRKADLLCYEKGLYVPFTLHDALYILHPANDLSAIDTACECLVEGFAHYYHGKKKELARKIMLDVETWGPDFKGMDEITTPKGRKVPVEDIHIDGRAIDEYKKFSKYFEPLDKEEVFS